MKRVTASVVLGLSLALAGMPASAQEKLDRTVLPIAEPKRPTYSELDARKAKPPARFEVKAPKGAPNVVNVLIDDIGFGGPSTFGGPIRTPTMDQLAQSGLRFNNFHTTALCSPTRVALKSGRNHHTANAGSIMETATALPGNTGQIPNSVAPLAEMLRLNGYSTGAFGKWHETAAWETSVSGPFDRWPTHQGFDKLAEVFAGFLEHTDHEIGRFKKALEDIGELDNTLFIYIGGDNGTSAEGGFVGMYNEMTYFNGVAEKVEDLIPLIDKWGGPETFPHMAAGWAVAFDAPFTWTKQVASDFGGTRNGVVIHWPKGIKEKGGLRRQFSHVIDIAPTILEAAGLPQPKSVNGVVQTPIEGTSMLYAFNDAKAPEGHKTQYFEMFGNRAIYHEGWFARTIHRAPWRLTNLPPLTSDVWELYDVRSDFSLTKNLAAEQPAKLKEMQALFMKEAQRYNVLPLDDRTIERTNPTLAGRPDVLGERTSLTLYEGMQGMLENTFMNVKNRSSKSTAELEIPAGGASGAILSQGGRFGGWSLYMKDGKPAYTYNFLGLARYTIAAPEALATGPATVTLDFAYDGGGVGKGGKATLYVNGKAVAEGRVEKTQPNIFSADETADVGIDNQTPVAEGIGIGPETRFTGTIDKITLEVRK